MELGGEMKNRLMAAGLGMLIAMGAILIVGAILALLAGINALMTIVLENYGEMALLVLVIGLIICFGAIWGFIFWTDE